MGNAHISVMGNTHITVMGNTNNTVMGNTHNTDNTQLLHRKCWWFQGRGREQRKNSSSGGEGSERTHLQGERAVKELIFRGRGQ